MENKNRMKKTGNKILIAVLAAVMLAVSLTGCGAGAGAINTEITSIARAGAEATAGVAEVINPAASSAETLKDVSVGDTVKYGKYEQDANVENGAEEIEWIVIGKAEGRILVISKYCIDAMPYNEVEEGSTVPNNISWENCTLRKWLNGTFIETAFSEDERGAIPVVKIANYGGSTEDKVFLMSIAEAKSADFAMDTAEKRIAGITDYAKTKGVATYAGGEDKAEGEGKTGGSWWLRSPGVDSATAAIVHFNGSLIESGRAVSTADRGVRPVMWINVG